MSSFPTLSNIPDYLKITDAMGATLIYLTIEVFIDIYAAGDAHLLHLVSSVPLLLTALQETYGQTRSPLVPELPGPASLGIANLG